MDGPTGDWIIPTGCDYLSDEDLQNRIVLENDSVYYYEEDMSDKHFKLVKKIMPLK